MKTIPRNTILLNDADYASGDLSVDEGKVVIAGTPIEIRWSKFKEHKVSSYNAGNYHRKEFDFSAITANALQAHILTLVNGNTNALQREVSRTAFGDASATPEQISDILGPAFVAQNLGSVFKCSFDDGTNVLTVDLEDPEYPALAYRGNIAGLSITDTPAVAPVGSSDAAGVSGYDPAKQYVKYELWEEGTFPEDGRDIPCLFHDVIYVDTTEADFPTDWAAVVESGDAIAEAPDTAKHNEVPSA